MQKLLLTFLCTCVSALVFHLNAQQFKALMVVQTAGWQHESTFDAIPALQKLAKLHDFTLDVKQRAMPLTDQQLARYDVLLMVNTTGDVFTDAEQGAVERFIQSGKGWVGVHAASDTEYDWKWYTDMVGHMFHIHPVVQTAMLEVQEPDFPGLTAWPKRMLWTDEYYEYKDGSKKPGFNYVLTVDESTYDITANWGGDRIAKGHGDFHPIAWYHNYDGGRAFYTNLGHVPAVFGEPAFLQHLYGGIWWAAKGKK
ncbi:ThuA domain-containing protein [Neolewinella lacunae]|uniref:ThuA domain-containing protein n=1 Tax=Neolewinella lacunae TaxID=1517758 RepID=A0A923PH50_9BACT|nr:ThuA domain-containing protein [Neolewinella lacunae]MBC6994028.1 ThuA domain-containing protein [Neolewinella lacunae]MDN3634698.1 ThuA domain-containing protein [Neolewinella lacunae]